MQIIGKSSQGSMRFFVDNAITLPDPEDSIDLTYKIDDQEQSVDVTCAVHNIYPLPEIKLL